MKKNITRIPALLLCAALVLGGCGQTNDLTKNIETGTSTDTPSFSKEKRDTGQQAAMDFSVTLLQHAMQENVDTNVCISPISVLYALCMTANGANGDTLAQMEEMFGTDRDAMNAFLSDYQNTLPSEKKCRTNIANSIWFNKNADVAFSDEFLSQNKALYDAELYEAAFDKQTQSQINRWVKKNTDGMIPEVIKEIPPRV